MKAEAESEAAAIRQATACSTARPAKERRRCCEMPLPISLQQLSALPSAPIALTSVSSWRAARCAALPTPLEALARRKEAVQHLARLS